MSVVRGGDSSFKPYGVLITESVRAAEEVFPDLENSSIQMAETTLEIKRLINDWTVMELPDSFGQSFHEPILEQRRIVSQIYATVFPRASCILSDMALSIQTTNRPSLKNKDESLEFYGFATSSIEVNEGALREAREHLLAKHMRLNSSIFIFHEKYTSAQRHLNQAEQICPTCVRERKKAWPIWNFGWFGKEASSPAPLEVEEENPVARQLIYPFPSRDEQNDRLADNEKNCKLPEFLSILLNKKTVLLSIQTSSNPNTREEGCNPSLYQGLEEGSCSPKETGALAAMEWEEEKTFDLCDVERESGEDEIDFFSRYIYGYKDLFRGIPFFSSFFDRYQSGVAIRKINKKICQTVDHERNALIAFRAELSRKEKEGKSLSSDPQIIKSSWESSLVVFGEKISSSVAVYREYSRGLTELETHLIEGREDLQKMSVYKIDPESIETLKGLRFPTWQFKVYDLLVSHLSTLISELDILRTELHRRKSPFITVLNGAIYDRDYYMGKIKIPHQLLFYTWLGNGYLSRELLLQNNTSKEEGL